MTSIQPPSRRRQRPAPRAASRGIALIEALIGVLIFAFGVIGLVGLQVAMTKAQGSAKYRADAAYLSSSAIGMIWADQANIAQYNSSGSCASHPACKDWRDKVVATLPSATSAIAASGTTGVVSITLTWTVSGEGTHTHVVTTSVR